MFLEILIVLAVLWAILIFSFTLINILKIIKNKPKFIIESLLMDAGVETNGHASPGLQIHDKNFYSRVLQKGPLGLGESYMDRWWDCENIDQFIDRVLRFKLDKKIKRNLSMLLPVALSIIFNRQSKSRAYRIGEKHYDLGNELFQNMLDKQMNYTCGYWKEADNLDEAQDAKLDLVCRKIGLKRGQKILDIGCGWGSFAKFAVEKYGAEVVGVTVSEEQVKLGNKLCKGLPVEIRFQDYRDVDEIFDHIVSLGMIEHIGYKNYHEYFKITNRCLKDDGLLLLHTIGSNNSVKSTDPWTNKYIFPNSILPSISQLSKAAEGLFVVEDLHNFGADYDKTLMAWYKNFESNWDKIKDNYNERFYRMWKYYLLSCAGSFRSRRNQLWQIVLSKNGVLGGYKSIR